MKFISLAVLALINNTSALRVEDPIQTESFQAESQDPLALAEAEEYQDPLALAEAEEYQDLLPFAETEESQDPLAFAEEEESQDP